MDPQRNSDDFPFFYFQNPMSGSKVSPKRFSLSTVLMGPCSWDRKARKAEKPKIQKSRVLGQNFRNSFFGPISSGVVSRSFMPNFRLKKIKNEPENQFLVSNFHQK